MENDTEEMKFEIGEYVQIKSGLWKGKGVIVDIKQDWDIPYIVKSKIMKGCIPTMCFTEEQLKRWKW